MRLSSPGSPLFIPVAVTLKWPGGEDGKSTTTKPRILDEHAVGINRKMFRLTAKKASDRLGEQVSRRCAADAQDTCPKLLLSGYFGVCDVY
jgi:hypothetical protein